MEKSRDAVTVANIRTAYAQAATEILTSDDAGKAGTYSSEQDVVCKGQQSGLSDLEKELPVDQAGKEYVKENCGAAKGATVKLKFTWTIDDEGKDTVTIGAPSK